MVLLGKVEWTKIIIWISLTYGRYINVCQMNHQNNFVCINILSSISLMMKIIFELIVLKFHKLH